jgi:hypothetical protein
MANAATVNADLTALLRARNSLILIKSDDELRVKRAGVGFCGNAKFPLRYWDCKRGITDSEGARIAAANDPNAVLDFISSRKERAVYMLMDLHKWFDPIILRALRNLSEELQIAPPVEARSIILLSPMVADIPRDVPEMTIIEYPLPVREEVEAILTQAIESLPVALRENAAPNGQRDRAIDGALGLAAFQISNSYSRSLVTNRTVDPALVAGEKKRIISGIPGVTWYEPDPRGLDAIGGLGELKAWCLKRRIALTPAARAYGLPAPKGMLLVGPAGTGKSLTAKCVATVFGWPLLRFDPSATLDKYVGNSEGNFRRVLELADTVAPCVLWCDEIDKALAGSGGGDQGDGGIAKKQLGTLLSWMQEHTSPVFVVATANDVSALPPELLRKGRFDELFFVDLPNHTERCEILAATLKMYRREGIDLARVASATDGFVGAEIAALVPDAMFSAFADGERPLTTDDLTLAASTLVPLSKTASEKLTALRTWAQGRARPASTVEAPNANTVRSLDL